MNTPIKRHRVSNLRLSEISSVDRPAQVGAVSVLIKSAGVVEVSDVEIRKSAAAVVAGSEAKHTCGEYEGAMLRRADELAAYHRISPEQALLKGLGEDVELRNLAHASEVARASEYGSAVRKRHVGAQA